MFRSRRMIRRMGVAAAASCWLMLSACGDGSGLPPQLSVNGTVSNLASGESVTLENNGTDRLTVSANGFFTFPTLVNLNGSYDVTIATQPKSQVCTVSNASGAGVVSNVTNLAVTCSIDTFPISGTLSGLPAGEQIVLKNNGADALRLSANGTFKFATPIAYDGSYAVTVSTQPAEATCSVTHGMGAGVTAAVAAASVVCSLDTYAISGTVSGLASGSQVTLDDNGADALTVTANGAFTFATAVAAGGSYLVTVGTQPVGETCTVLGGQGARLGGNVSSVSVTCSSDTFSIGGTLSGLANGSQVTLDDNGADPLTLTANGPFTFATPVVYAGSYDVTVGTSPSGQHCTISNPSASGITANVTGVSVTCVPLSVSFTTPGSYNWTVPAGVTSVQIGAIGGGGGGGGLSGINAGQAGGAGALVTSTLSVTAGQTLALIVGGGGGAGANGPAGGGGGYTFGAGGGGGGASTVDAGGATQIIAGGGGGGGRINGTTGGAGGGAGGAGGAGGSNGGPTGGAGGSAGTGGAGGSFMFFLTGGAGGNGSGGAGGSGGSNGGSAYPGGAGGSSAGSGIGGTDTNNDQAGGGGGGYGGGGSGVEGTGGGAGGSTGPAGTTYAAASNGGSSATAGGGGSITITPQ